MAKRKDVCRTPAADDLLAKFEVYPAKWTPTAEAIASLARLLRHLVKHEQTNADQSQQPNETDKQ